MIHKLLGIGVVLMSCVPQLFAQPNRGQLPNIPAGSIAVQDADGRFKPLGANPVLPNDQLMTVIPGTILVSENLNLAITSLADFTGSSPIPVLETALILHGAGKADWDITLDRGRLDMINRRTSGASRVIVRIQNESWEITLDRPGSRMAVELCGRWPAGTRFLKNPPPQYQPTRSAVAICLAGTARISDGKTSLALSAPPGPAMVAWTSTLGATPSAMRLDRMPDWANPQLNVSPTSLRLNRSIEKYRLLRNEADDKALELMLTSADEADRRIGLVVAGAQDDLPRLIQAIRESTDYDLWDFGITVLRHWLGRKAGQEQRLHRYLMESSKLTANVAETVIALLIGFSEVEIARPETYELLIEYLQHDQRAIRNLSLWHLVRLVPDGRQLRFLPNASKSDITPVYLQWKRLIPSGRVPPRPKEDNSK